jgi:hypothetical protein
MPTPTTSRSSRFTGKRDKRRPGVLADSPWPERKIDQVMPLMRRAAATGRSQVVAIGVAQEYQWVLTGTKSETGTSAVWFSHQRVDRRVVCFYFYLWDADFGPALVKFCAYFPVRHEAPCNRVEVKGLHRRVVAAA